MKISNTLMALACTCILSQAAWAQEDVIRKNLPARLPQFKQIDEVRKSEIGGLYEVRVDGSEIYYTDAKADFLIEGSLIDTRSKRNLTEERVEKLTAIKFDSLPLKDAFVVVRGNGERKLAVFEDPNCGYCKRFERDLQKVDNVTIYMFLYPILGADSVEKSKAIWCAKDRVAAWLDWMLRDQSATSAAAGCDATALSRNVELGRKHKINGTPTLLFTNGSRVPGAVDAKKVEQMLAQAAKS
jgi:thiol:disulfide interchange protein DsbC